MRSVPQGIEVAGAWCAQGGRDEAACAVATSPAPKACRQGLHHAHAQTKCGARVAVCEGDKKGFGVKFVKGEKGKVVAFKKGGCLGTSSFIGKPYNKSAAAIDLSWPEEGVPQARACRLRRLLSLSWVLHGRCASGALPTDGLQCPLACRPRENAPHLFDTLGHAHACCRMCTVRPHIIAACDADITWLVLPVSPAMSPVRFLRQQCPCRRLGPLSMRTLSPMCECSCKKCSYIC